MGFSRVDGICTLSVVICIREGIREGFNPNAMHYVLRSRRARAIPGYHFKPQILLVINYTRK